MNIFCVLWERVLDVGVSTKFKKYSYSSTESSELNTRAVTSRFLPNLYIQTVWSGVTVVGAAPCRRFFSSAIGLERE